MKIHFVSKLPTEHVYPICDRMMDITESVQKELSPVVAGTVDSIWFWYTYGCYEGDGEMLIKGKNGKWWYRSLGHCSCYGPIDGLESTFRPEGQTLDMLLMGFDPGSLERMEPLLAAINRLRSKPQG